MKNLIICLAIISLTSCKETNAKETNAKETSAEVSNQCTHEGTHKALSCDIGRDQCVLCNYHECINFAPSKCSWKADTKEQ